MSPTADDTCTIAAARTITAAVAVPSGTASEPTTSDATHCSAAKYTVPNATTASTQRAADTAAAPRAPAVAVASAAAAAGALATPTAASAAATATALTSVATPVATAALAAAAVTPAAAPAAAAVQAAQHGLVAREEHRVHGTRRQHGREHALEEPPRALTAQRGARAVCDAPAVQAGLVGLQTDADRVQRLRQGDAGGTRRAARHKRAQVHSVWRTYAEKRCAIVLASKKNNIGPRETRDRCVFW